MTISTINFIYGLCVMFYCMMAWFFYRKNREILSRTVATLMFVLAFQCVKDLFFIDPDSSPTSEIWMFMTTTDMIAVPIYAFILIELCRPGTLTLKLIIVNELPFVILPIMFITTRLQIFYYADVVWTAIYGSATAIWAIVGIPKYHRLLKERFSYEENINLNWLRYILLSFFVILSLWVLDCVIVDLNIEALYMGGTLIIWMFICYFLYRHESVIDELKMPIIVEEAAIEPIEDTSVLNKCIQDLFENQKIYLNPQLRLSDVANMANSNRTYVSRYFNDNHGKTFFEFVNEYRVNYAKTLLRTSDEKLDVIAEQSGFNSRQSFHRVFVKFTGYTPEQYRNFTPPYTPLIISVLSNFEQPLDDIYTRCYTVYLKCYTLIGRKRLTLRKNTLSNEKLSPDTTLALHGWHGFWSRCPNLHYR